MNTCSRPSRGSTHSAVRMIHGALSPDAGTAHSDFRPAAPASSGFAFARRVFARAGRGLAPGNVARRRDAGRTNRWPIRKFLRQFRQFRLRRILLPQPRKIFFRNPRNRIQRQAQAHRRIAGDEPERVVIAQKPRAGHPAARACHALDRQRVADDSSSSLAGKSARCVRAPACPSDWIFPA